MPDIVILDLSIMPEMSGLALLAKVKSKDLPTRLVFFTASVREREMTALTAAGAYGVFLKDQELDVLVKSLRQIAAGQRVLPLPSSEGAPITRQPR